MPINWTLLKEDAVLAESFLVSQKGVLLHELGHYVAANAETVVPGRIILNKHSGSFRSEKRLDAYLTNDQFAFVCAAGALAEQHFCGTTRHQRLGPDLAQYIRVRPPADPATRVIDIIEEWKRSYSERVSILADCIESNFERCVGYVVYGRFLFEGQHFISSTVLSPPCKCSWTGLAAP